MRFKIPIAIQIKILCTPLFCPRFSMLRPTFSSPLSRRACVLLGCTFFTLAGRAGDSGVREAAVSRPGVLHLTLESAVQMALAKNFAIQVEQFAPRVAREQVTSELGRFDPAFQLSIAREKNVRRDVFGRSIDPDTGDVSGGFRLRDSNTNTVDRLSAGLAGTTAIGTRYDLGFDSNTASGTSNRFNDDVSSSTGLSLTQPLLRGFGTDVNLAQVRIARNNVQVSEWQYRDQIINTVTELEYVYNDLHTAHQNLLAAERSRALAQQLVENNTRRATIGVMTPLDVTTARAEVAAREEGVILARRNVLDNENFVKQLVTTDLARMLSVRVEIEPPPPMSARADVLGGVRDALELRPDYRQRVLEIQRRNIALVVAKNDLLPRIDLTASLDLLGTDDDFGTSVSRIGHRDQTVWSIGALVSIPIGNRTARGNFNATKLEAARTLVQLQQLEQQIIVDVDNAAGQITTNQERIDSTTEARKLAAESLAAGEERLRAGTGTTFEVLELQDKLAQAEFAELRARSDFNKAVAEFHRKTGTTLRVRNVVLK